MTHTHSQKETVLFQPTTTIKIIKISTTMSECMSVNKADKTEMILHESTTSKLNVQGTKPNYSLNFFLAKIFFFINTCGALESNRKIRFFCTVNRKVIVVGVLLLFIFIFFGWHVHVSV